MNKVQLEKNLTISTEQIKEWCQYRPGHLSVCYDPDNKKYYLFSEGRWIEDTKLNNTDRLIFGTIRKLGQYYYVYDGVSQWVMFGEKEPVHGDMLKIRDTYYMYTWGKLEKIANKEVIPNWDIFKRFYVEHISKNYECYDLFYDAWINGFPIDVLAQEGYKILEQHMGSTAYIRLIKDSFDGNLRERELLYKNKEDILNNLINDIECVLNYIPTTNINLREYFNSKCENNNCFDCVKVFFDLIK